MKIFLHITSKTVLANGSKKSILYIIRKETLFGRVSQYQNESLYKKIYIESLKTYQTFSKGTILFIKDLRRYLLIKKTLKTGKQNYAKLIRHEIEVYHQMPKDISKVALTLFLASLPVVFYFMLPAIYVFPKQLLCSHFWTLEQKQKFRAEYVRSRLRYNAAILGFLHSEANVFKSSLMYEPWIITLNKVENGEEITVSKLLKFKVLFECQPYCLDCLKPRHLRYLTLNHDIPGRFNSKTKLLHRALDLIEMDRAIQREGGVHNMTDEALRNACYIRGKNPNEEFPENLMNWLNQWIKVSNETRIANLSLLLHCSILLGHKKKSMCR